MLGGRKSEEHVPNLPNAQDFSNDPVTAISMGLGWLGATVSKSAKVGMDEWVKPGMETLASSEIGSVAQHAASQINQGIQTSTRSAADALNRFVDHESDNDMGTTRRMDGTTWTQRTDNIWSDRFASFNRTGQSLWDSIGAGSANFASMLTGEQSDQRFHSQAKPGAQHEVNPDLAYGTHHDFPPNYDSKDELPGATIPVASAKKSALPAAKTKSTSAGDDFWVEYGLAPDAEPEVGGGSKKD